MMKFFNNKTALTFVAVFTAVILFVTSLTITPVSASSSDSTDAYIMRNGQEISSLLLEEDDKVVVEAFSEIEEKGYCWQISDVEDTDRWINITDAYSPRLSVTYALVASMLRSDGSTAIRCKLTAKNGDLFYTKPLDVKISYHINEETSSLYEPVQTFSVPIYACRSFR